MRLSPAIHWFWREFRAVIVLLPLALAILAILTQWPLSDVTFLYVEL
ncbi:hypothetical protein [Microbaculum marinum]|uniref:ABC transporter permease n=1 Tax=Microbaculum marinum TaxID=1764581 RepID=A0AAW9RF63_9HYPH